MNEFQSTIDKINSGELSWDELAVLSRHKAQGIRGCAIIALARMFPDEDRTIELLRTLATNGENSDRIFGAHSIAEACVVLLDGMKSPYAHDVASELWAAWPEHDRENLKMLRQHGL